MKANGKPLVLKTDAEKFEETIEDKIAKHGYTVIISRGQEDTGSESSPCAYTVGLADKGWPEIIAMGSPGGNPAALKNFIDAQVRHWNQQFAETGKLVLGNTTQVLAGLFADETPSATVTIDVNQTALLYASYVGKRYNGKPVRMVQFLWPDMALRLPHQDGYDHDNFPQKCLPMLN